MVSKELENKIVCVVGLGYVGLPLAKAFSRYLKTIGFDIDESKIKGLDCSDYDNLICTTEPNQIRQADFVIVCVPTPVTKSKEPDLSPVESAAKIVGNNLKKGAIVVLESTVYPGVTEDIVVPILEKESELRCGSDFNVGYSPERINPGDERHSLDKITKIVSGMDEKTLETLSELYSLITNVYRAKDIKTAEAAKVIENIQRDLNIALANELSIIFKKIGLDAKEVFEAASTKWNFHRYSPGLVGGHCIPVDPYYLVHRAKELGYHPQVILAGRMINDSMPSYVAEIAIKGLNQTGKVIKNSKIIIMGLTYKEDVPDIRESPAFNLIKSLSEYGIDIYGYDPLLGKQKVEEFGIHGLNDLNISADGIILTVWHDMFSNIDLGDVKKIIGDKGILVDVRGVFKAGDAKERGIWYASL